MHAEKCGELESAVVVALDAANAAWQSFAEPEALAMLGNAVRLAAQAGDAMPATSRDTLLGDAAMLECRIDILRGRYDSALRCAERGREHYRNAHNERKSIAALNQRAWILCHKNAYAQSESDAREALALARQCNDDSETSNAFNVIGNVRFGRCFTTRRWSITKKVWR